MKCVIRKTSWRSCAALLAALAGCSGQTDMGMGAGGMSGAGSGGAPGGAGGGGVGGAAGGGPGGVSGSCPSSWTPTADCGGLPSDAVPDFGPNVIIFDPSMSASSMQNKLNDLYGQQDGDPAQFGDGRFAYFFKPGSYSLDVKIGFYTQLLGLGRSPDDVSINGAVRSKADWLGQQNATCNFWRGAEGFSVTPRGDIDGGKEVWAVSQGTMLRRVHVKGDINLDDGGWSSGGFIVDSLVDGTMNSGTQQQFLTRNVEMRWAGKNWNMVFVGDKGAPGDDGWPDSRYTTVQETPRVREKPFLYLDAAGHYLVMVPRMKTHSVGYSWGDGSAPGVPLPIDAFYIAHAGKDTASTLNAALAAGKHLLLTPGTYHLDASLQVQRPGTIVMGLGYATLMPDNATPAITIADVDGVTLASVLVEAGTKNPTTLVQVGADGSSADHSANPTFLFDYYCRVGGRTTGTAKSCLIVNSNDVVLDNLWLWRADHGDGGSDWNGLKSANGIIVNGARVTAYGLFVEHFQQYQTLWNGNGGEVYFYQSEMPYDPPNQGAWMAAPGHNGYPSYKVADAVTSHHGVGIGVYTVFGADVAADNAIEGPKGASMYHMMDVSLASGHVTHIYNGQGDQVGDGGKFDAYYTP